MRFSALLILVCALAACAGAKPDSSLSGAKTREWLDAHLRQSAPVVFTSHNGISYGADSDAKIAFEKNGRVEVTLFGYTPVTYGGTWSIDRTGLIKLALPDDPAKWPGTRLFPDGGDATLFPADGNPAAGLGDTPGAAPLAGMNPYWPFRYRAGVENQPAAAARPAQ